MARYKLLVVTLLMLCFAAVGPADAGWFGKRTVHGSGDLTTQQRDLPGFSRIRASGAFDVHVTIGDRQSVSVTFDDNLIDMIKSEVDDETLELFSEGSYSSDRSCRIEITVSELTSVKVSGSGDFTIEGLSGEQFSYKISGSGDATLSGQIDELEIGVSGSGDVDARNLKAKTAHVGISGSGDVEVWAEEVFDGSIAGSGDIAYYGNPPKVSRHVAGSGDIEKK